MEAKLKQNRDQVAHPIPAGFQVTPNSEGLLREAASVPAQDLTRAEPLADQDRAKIVHVCPRRAGREQIIQRRKGRVGIIARQ